MDSDSEGLRNIILALLDEAYACRVNNLPLSIKVATDALAHSRMVDDKILVSKSLNHLALFHMIMGEYKKSSSLSEEAIRYCEELNDEKGIADAKYNLAGICYKTDNHHLGLVYLLDCLVIYKKFDDFHNLSRSAKSLGTIYEYFGDIANAEKQYLSAIESAKKVGDLNLESNSYNNLSGTYLKQNKISKAQKIIAKSIAIKRKTGDTRGLAFAIYGRGKVFTRTKEFDLAEKDFIEAMKIYGEMGERLGMAVGFNKLGALYIEMNLLTKAKETLNEGVEFSDNYNIVIGKLKCSYNLFLIYKKENDATNSLLHLERYQQLKEQVMRAQTLRSVDSYEIIVRMKEMEKEAQVQRENAEIIEKKNRAEEALRIKQEFLSTMSHEIRTPLNAVITIGSLLKERADSEDKKLLDSLKFSGNNLLMIINDILDFTKLDSGKMQLEKRPADFQSLFRNIKNTYQTLANDKGLELSLKLDDRTAESYELDETRLTQIMGNLLSNSIKFTEQGSVGIEIELLEEHPDLDMVRFCVTDTGEGIDLQHLNEIFESFAQPRFVTTRKKGGTGLGLSIVKKLVALHESNIQVTSKVGEGSKFFFDLQLRKSDKPVAINVEQTVKLKNKTALLVEDNLLNAFVAEKLLEQWGVVSDHAVNGIEAVEKCRKKKFDFIFMDIHMPDMNGYDAAVCIQSNRNLNSSTPIFALTADITADLDEKYTSHFSGFLTKPIEREKLLEMMMNV